MEGSSRELAGQVALVTGGARGIGRYIAEALARGGCAVGVGCTRPSDEADEVVARCRELGVAAEIAAADLGDERATAAMHERVAGALGAVSVLVHNAAPARIKAPLVDTAWDEYERQFRVGVRGAWSLARACLPSMRQAGFGRIVLISTTSSGLYVDGFGAYCVAKAAMETFARYLAVEVGRDGITVNVVAPGVTVKGATEGHRRDARFPIGRTAHASDVAATVAHLASPAASGITGCSVPVDGGLRLLEPIRGVSSN